MNLSRVLATLSLSVLALAQPACVTDPDDSTLPIGQDESALSTSLVALHVWWSPTQGDYRTTADPAWIGSRGAARSGYLWVGTAGKVFAPGTPPPGTLPLYQWFNATRGDYFLTSDPAWAATTPGTLRGGYSFVRREGHLFPTARASTLKLTSWWHGGREDNLTTSAPAWDAALGGSSGGYAHYRDEGYVVIGSVDDVSSDVMERSDFNVGGMKVAGRAATGTRLTLGIMLDYSDKQFSDPTTLSRNLVGPAFPNVRAYYSEVSQGRYSINLGSVAGPYRIADDAATPGDESKLPCAVEPTTCSGLAWAVLQTTAALCGGATCFVGPQNGGGGAVLASSAGAGFEHELAIVDIDGAPLKDGDRIRIRASEGQYLRAVNGGGGAVLADTLTPGGDAVFILQRQAGAGNVVETGDQVSFKTSTGAHYLQAVGGGGGAVDARATTRQLFRLSEGMSVGHILRDAVRRAVAGGVDLGRFDVDGNHIVTDGEFALIVMVPQQVGASASTRTVAGVGGCFDAGRGYQVCGQGSLVMENSGFATVAHEMTHLLGAWDLYPPFCSNSNVTLMGCTAGNLTYHLDPWHKMNLGWALPRIHRLDQPAAVVRLAAPGRSPTISDNSRPVLLYDPRLSGGRTRYLLVEYRDQAGYDANVPARGLVVWDVRLSGPNGNPMLYGPAGAQGWEVVALPSPTGSGLVWPLGSAGTPRWQDGTSSGVTLRATASTSNEVVLEWRPDFAPRVDASTLDHAVPGVRVTMTGVFGAADSATDWVELQSGSARYRATIRVLSETQVGFDVPTAPRGTYDVVFHDGWSDALSNTLRFTVD